MTAPRLRLTPLVATLALLAAACAGSTTSSAGQPAPTTAPTSPSPSTEPEAIDGDVVAEGAFEPIQHQGAGTASLVDTGKAFEVALTDFEVEDGPALRVYLSAAPAGSPESKYDDDFADLGPLESSSGDQTYTVPEGMDIAGYHSVVIWCADFSVGFTVAPLDAV